MLEKKDQQDSMLDIWSLLVKSKVDIVLTAHDHDYQRWIPLDGTGLPNFKGSPNLSSERAGMVSRHLSPPTPAWQPDLTRNPAPRHLARCS